MEWGLTLLPRPRSDFAVKESGMAVVEEAFERARGREARVVLPEAEDRIEAAAARLRTEGIAEVVP